MSGSQSPMRAPITRQQPGMMHKTHTMNEHTIVKNEDELTVEPQLASPPSSKVAGEFFANSRGKSSSGGASLPDIGLSIPAASGLYAPSPLPDKPAAGNTRDFISAIDDDDKSPRRRADDDEDPADEASGSQEGERVSSAELRRRADREKELVLRGHTGSVESLCFFTTTRGTLRLASGSLDCSIKVWNPLSRVDGPINTLLGHRAPVMCLDVYHQESATRAHTSEPRLASGSEDGTVRVWDPAGDPSGPAGAHGSALLLTLVGHVGAVYALCCFVDEQGLPRVASGAEDTMIRVWDPTPVNVALSSIRSGQGSDGMSGGSFGRCLAILEGHAAWVTALGTYDAFFHASVSVGATPLPGAHDGTGSPMGHKHAAAGMLPPLVRRPRLVSGSMDMTVRVWDPAGGRLNVLKGHRSWVHAVAPFVSPSGDQRVASASSDHSVRIWDPRSLGAALAVIDAHKAHVWCLAVTYDRKAQARVVSGSEDHTVRCWDPAVKKQLPLFKCFGKGVGMHARGVKAVATFTLEGGERVTASGGEDNVVKVWDIGSLGITAGKATSQRLPPQSHAEGLPAADRITSIAQIVHAKKGAAFAKKRFLFMLGKDEQSPAAGATDAADAEVAVVAAEAETGSADPAAASSLVSPEAPAGSEEPVSCAVSCPAE